LIVTQPKPAQVGFGKRLPTWQLWLDGPKDLVSVLDVPPSPEDSQQRACQLAAMNVRPLFYGASRSDATHVIVNGWPEGAKIVETLGQQIAEQLPPPKSRRLQKRWKDEGDEASFERYQRGQDAWRSCHRQLKSSCGLIELVASWGEGCSASQQQLQWSGAAALAVTDLLEKADYSVELCLVAAMQDRYIEMVRVDLKRMGEPLDLENLAGVAVYPPAWRIFGLAAFQLGPMSSGDNYNSHPHARALDFEPNGMWAYRPNVMTVTLNGSRSESEAIRNATDALRQVEALVNPQDSEVL